MGNAIKFLKIGVILVIVLQLLVAPAMASNLGRLKQRYDRLMNLISPPPVPHVRFIYLIPKDKEFRKEVYDAIKDAALSVQQWYGENVGNGKTFTLSNPIVEVYKTPNPATYYAAVPSNRDKDWWHYQATVMDGLPIVDGSFNDSMNRYVFFIDSAVPADLGVSLGGTINWLKGSGQGVAVINPKHMEGLVRQYISPSKGDMADQWRGIVAHELGHAFGFPHTENSNENARHALMVSYRTVVETGCWEYPRCILLEDEKNKLSQSPFFNLNYIIKGHSGEELIKRKNEILTIRTKTDEIARLIAGAQTNLKDLEHMAKLILQAATVAQDQSEIAAIRSVIHGVKSNLELTYCLSAVNREVKSHFSVDDPPIGIGVAPFRKHWKTFIETSPFNIEKDAISAIDRLFDHVETQMHKDDQISSLLLNFGRLLVSINNPYYGKLDGEKAGFIQEYRKFLGEKLPPLSSKIDQPLLKKSYRKIESDTSWPSLPDLSDEEFKEARAKLQKEFWFTSATIPEPVYDGNGVLTTPGWEGTGWWWKKWDKPGYFKPIEGSLSIPPRLVLGHAASAKVNSTMDVAAITRLAEMKKIHGEPKKVERNIVPGETIYSFVKNGQLYKFTITDSDFKANPGDKNYYKTNEARLANLKDKYGEPTNVERVESYGETVYVFSDDILRIPDRKLTGLYIAPDPKIFKVVGGTEMKDSKGRYHADGEMPVAFIPIRRLEDWNYMSFGTSQWDRPALGHYIVTDPYTRLNLSADGEGKTITVKKFSHGHSNPAVKVNFSLDESRLPSDVVRGDEVRAWALVEGNAVSSHTITVNDRESPDAVRIRAADKGAIEVKLNSPADQEQDKFTVRINSRALINQPDPLEVTVKYDVLEAKLSEPKPLGINKETGQGLYEIEAVVKDKSGAAVSGVAVKWSLGRFFDDGSSTQSEGLLSRPIDWGLQSGRLNSWDGTTATLFEGKTDGSGSVKFYVRWHPYAMQVNPQVTAVFSIDDTTAIRTMTLPTLIDDEIKMTDEEMNQMILSMHAAGKYADDTLGAITLGEQASDNQVEKTPVDKAAEERTAAGAEQDRIAATNKEAEEARRIAGEEQAKKAAADKIAEEERQQGGQQSGGGQGHRSQPGLSERDQLMADLEKKAPEVMEAIKVLRKSDPPKADRVAQAIALEDLASVLKVVQETDPGLIPHLEKLDAETVAAFKRLVVLSAPAAALTPAASVASGKEAQEARRLAESAAREETAKQGEAERTVADERRIQEAQKAEKERLAKSEEQKRKDEEARQADALRKAVGAQQKPQAVEGVKVEPVQNFDEANMPSVTAERSSTTVSNSEAPEPIGTTGDKSAGPVIPVTPKVDPPQELMPATSVAERNEKIAEVVKVKPAEPAKEAQKAEKERLANAHEQKKKDEENRKADALRKADKFVTPEIHKETGKPSNVDTKPRADISAIVPKVQLPREELTPTTAGVFVDLSKNQTAGLKAFVETLKEKGQTIKEAAVQPVFISIAGRSEQYTKPLDEIVSVQKQGDAENLAFNFWTTPDFKKTNKDVRPGQEVTMTAKSGDMEMTVTTQIPKSGVKMEAKTARGSTLAASQKIPEEGKVRVEVTNEKGLKLDADAVKAVFVDQRGKEIPASFKKVSSMGVQSASSLRLLGTEDKEVIEVEVPPEVKNNLGSYTLKLNVEDMVGNAGSLEIQNLTVAEADLRITDTPRNFPNPFSIARDKQTAIIYTLSKDADINIILYDISGQMIARKSAMVGTVGGRVGLNEVPWEGRSDFGYEVGNGVYSYVILSQGKILGRGQLSVAR